jgi:hypothetical protein
VKPEEKKKKKMMIYSAMKIKGATMNFLGAMATWHLGLVLL